MLISNQGSDSNIYRLEYCLFSGERRKRMFSIFVKIICAVNPLFNVTTDLIIDGMVLIYAKWSLL